MTEVAHTVRIDPLQDRYHSISLLWVSLFAISLFTGIFLAQLFAGLGGLLALFVLLKKGTGRPIRHPAGWALVAVAVVFVLASLFGHRPYFSLSQIVRNFLLPLVGFFSTLLLARSEKVRTRAVSVFIVAGVISGLYALFQHLFGYDPLYGQPIKGPLHSSGPVPLYIPKGLLNNTLTYAGVQATAFLFILPIVWRAHPQKGWKLWVALALLFLSVFISLKRGPLLAMFLVSGLFFMSRSRKAALITLLAGVVLIGGLFASSSAFRERISDTVNLSTRSENDRILLWDAAWRMGQDSPLLGVGPGCWRDFVHDYVPEDHDFVSLAHPHSDPFYLWATSGALGFLATLFLFLFLLYQGRRELFAMTAGSRERDIYSGGLLALLGFGIMSLTQCYLIDGENLLTLGFVLGLAFASREIGLRDHMIRVLLSPRGM